MSSAPHNTRVPDEVWAAAKARADAEHRTMSDAIVRLLRRYGEGTVDAEPAVPVVAAVQAQPQPAARKPGEPESASDIMAAIRNRRR